MQKCSGGTEPHAGQKRTAQCGHQQAGMAAAMAVFIDEHFAHRAFVIAAPEPGVDFAAIAQFDQISADDDSADQ